MRFLLRLAKRPIYSACALCCGLAGLLGACAYNTVNDAPRSSEIPPAINVNGIMVGSANRLALYTYEGDKRLQSNCLEACTRQWLPFYANDQDVSRGDFSIFTRQDGRKQWALVGKPLYFWAGELQPESQAKEAADPRWKVFRVQSLSAQ